ncbi:MAG: hypothetical protein J2P37_00150 [Ktedonobacteraceae bacterium]|nr:hypothetical protein [Ktedonobacteraceae bacterium]
MSEWQNGRGTQEAEVEELRRQIERFGLQEPWMLQDWQVKAIAQLMQTDLSVLEPDGSRVYVSSRTYGSSRYHIINQREDGIQVEQMNVDEKWPSRINVCADEIPAFVKTLLGWMLEALESERSQGYEPTPFDGVMLRSSDLDDDLDDQPF